MGNRMTLADLLCSLRQRLLDAKKHDNKRDLEELLITFGLLREASYTSQDEPTITILVALEDSARDFLGGMGFESDIPSVEAIRSALSSTTE